MSYCRWSDMDYKCDIYAYESAAGYEIHVAGRRYSVEIPSLPDIITTPIDEWMEAYQKRQAIMDNAPIVNIDLPRAGDSYTCQTLDEFETVLRNLRYIGFVVPEYVFVAIREEQAEQALGA